MEFLVTMFLRIAAICLLFALCLPLRAERLVFQRGDALHIASMDGAGVRRLFNMEAGTPWAPSPDGLFLAWFTPLSPAPVAVDEPPQPVSIWIGDLSGRSRRLVASTADLRTRQGERVTLVGADPATPLLQWRPVSIEWSTDGESLYISCVHTGEGGESATFVLDVLAGAAVVDANGRWRPLAPIAYVDAQWPLLVGIGTAEGRTAAAAAKAGAGPLILVHLEQGRTIPLLAKLSAGADAPAAPARAPSLSPDGRTVVFATTTDGVWTVAVRERTFRRVTGHRGDDWPRWSLGGDEVLFLGPDSAAAPGRRNLYRIEPGGYTPRRLILTDVDRFFVLPNPPASVDTDGVDS